MERLADVYERLGASDVEPDSGVPGRFARPTRSHEAVRAACGVTEHPWGILTLAGEDREEFLGDTVTCRVPGTEGSVTYGFLLDHQGRIEVDLYIAHVGERLLCLTAAGTAASLADTWSDRIFIQDVDIEDRTADNAVLGVHGPAASEKLSSISPDGTPPDDPMSLSRIVLREQGVTVVKLDAPIGEPGFAVVCRRAEAGAVFDALVNLGMLAVPFGSSTWNALTLEASTPLFETELSGRQPNVCGQIGTAVDLTKGCFIGQEVVARVANLASPRTRLLGLAAETEMRDGAAVFADGDRVGEVTRTAMSPTLDRPIAFALLDAEVNVGESVQIGDNVTPAETVSLPFVEGSTRSGRIPTYDD